jgi:hypothetical protein
VSRTQSRGGKRARNGGTPSIGRPKDENLKLRKERRRGIQTVFIYIDHAGSEVTCQTRGVAGGSPCRSRNITPSFKKACPQALERSGPSVQLGPGRPYANIAAIHPSTSEGLVVLGSDHGIPLACVGCL